MAFPGASRGPVPASGRAGAVKGLVLCLGGIGRLGSRGDLELDALDCTQLLGPPVIELPLARRGPNALGLGIGQPVRMVIPGPVTRGTPPVDRAFLYLGPEVGVPGIRAGIATTPDTPRLIDHSLAIRNNFQIPLENPEGHEDGENAQHGTQFGRAQAGTRQPSPTGGRQPRRRMLPSLGKGPWGAQPRRR